jgi:hypothetical protein
MKTIRCAVYTRKSNEEGLDLAFNSLDAQLEAGLDTSRARSTKDGKQSKQSTAMAASLAVR